MSPEFVNRISTWVRGGDIESAQAEIRAAGNRDPLLALVGEAILASMTGKPGLAASRADEAVSLAGDDPVVLRVAAVCHLVAGNKERAETLARRAANRDVTSDSLFTLGKVLLESGKHDEAERALQRVLEIDPNHFQALDGIGLSRLHRGDKPTALRYFAKAFEAAPDDATAMTHLKEMYRDAGWAFGAILLARVTRQGKHPDEVAVALDLMCLLLAHALGGEYPSAGMIPDADEIIADLLASSATRRPAVQLQVARTLYDMRRAESARVIVDRLEGSPMGDAERATWHYLKGLFEDADGRADEALTHYGAALECDGRRWDAACNAVNLLLAKGDTEALARIPEVLAKVPEEFKRYRPQLLFNEAVYLKTVNRCGEAAPLLRRVLALTDGRGPLADLAREMLAEVEHE